MSINSEANLTIYLLFVENYLSDFFVCFGRDIQEATSNFTTTIGQGAFGPVYKAQMSTGDTFAVKVLASNSTQGQSEFLTEVNSYIHNTKILMGCIGARCIGV